MRLVSLVPSVTETLIDLGLATQLVGITRFCIHPAATVAGLPKVGGTKDPKLDRIRDAAPDVVFMNAEENRKEDAEALAETLRVETSFPRRVDEVPADLRRIGRVCGVEAAAEARASALEAALAEVSERTWAPFTFAYLIWRDPWMTLNADTYVSDLLAKVGGRNVYGDDPTRYPATTLSDLAAHAPDVILLPDEPFPFKAPHAEEVQAALPGSAVELVGGDDLCWHGVRSIRGVTAARRVAEGISARRSATDT